MDGPTTRKPVDLLKRPRPSGSNIGEVQAQTDRWVAKSQITQVPFAKAIYAVKNMNGERVRLTRNASLREPAISRCGSAEAAKCRKRTNRAIYEPDTRRAGLP